MSPTAYSDEGPKCSNGCGEHMHVHSMYAEGESSRTVFVTQNDFILLQLGEHEAAQILIDHDDRQPAEGGVTEPDTAARILWNVYLAGREHPLTVTSETYTKMPGDTYSFYDVGSRAVAEFPASAVLAIVRLSS